MEATGEDANAPYEEEDERARVAEAIAINTWALMQSEIVKAASRAKMGFES